MRKWYTILVLSMGICGCNGAYMGNTKAAEEDIRLQLLNRGYSLEYVDGYEAGCASDVGDDVMKNEERYRSEKEYRRGWEQGVATCENPYGQISQQVLEEKKRTSSNKDLWNEMKK